MTSLLTRKKPVPKTSPKKSASTNGNSIHNARGDRFHWTVDLFYSAAEQGLFENPEEWELVNGELWRRETMNPPHASLVRRLAQEFRDRFDAEKYLVTKEEPIHLATDGEPQPDIAIVEGSLDMFDLRHPNQDDVRLVIEVADTTGRRDKKAKMHLYAAAGITEYWLSLINERKVLVHRKPASAKYLDVKRFDADAVISPLFAPDVKISVADLLPRPT